MKLAILTATHNHPHNLRELYKTLEKQEDSDFTWIIIDDGSGEDTGKTIRKMITENVIRIYYKRKENGGKSSAINEGLDLCEDFDFVIIVDDDEQLYPDAVITIKKYYADYKDTDCGIINFARATHDGMPILKMNQIEDFFCSIPELKRKGYYSDGYIGYFVSKLANRRFPLFQGEKYIGPSVLMMLVNENCSILWTRTVLGSTEYLEGGITQQGRRLRVKNPKGMIYHASLYLKNKKTTFYLRLGYSIRAYAYMYYACLNKYDLKREGIEMSVFYPVSLLGRLLAYQWRKMYQK